MTLLAGLFEMRGCWHIGLRWAIVALWATSLLSLPMCFRCYGNLKFPYTYNGKSGNWHLFLCYCRYFDKSFTEMLPTIWILSKSLILTGGHGNRKAKFLKNKKKKKKTLKNLEAAVLDVDNHTKPWRGTVFKYRLVHSFIYSFSTFTC